MSILDQTWTANSTWWKIAFCQNSLNVDGIKSQASLRPSSHVLKFWREMPHVVSDVTKKTILSSTDPWHLIFLKGSYSDEQLHLSWETHKSQHKSTSPPPLDDHENQCEVQRAADFTGSAPLSFEAFLNKWKFVFPRHLKSGAVFLSLGSALRSAWRRRTAADSSFPRHVHEKTSSGVDVKYVICG